LPRQVDLLGHLCWYRNIEPQTIAVWGSVLVEARNVGLS
jgi:hypothetical protein